MATTTVYASGESGWVQAHNTTYLTAARADTGTDIGVTATVARVGQMHSGTFYICFEAFLKWDTSAVGSDTVTNVDFEVDGETNDLDRSFVIEGYAYDWGSTLTTADYLDSDTDIPALGDTISSYDTAGGWTTTAGYNQTLGALSAFNSAINGSGDTLVVLISAYHRTESAPTISTGEYAWFQGTGNTNDARLTITHEPSLTLTYIAPDADVTTTGWATAPLWSKVDDDPASPDATVITGAAS